MGPGFYPFIFAVSLTLLCETLIYFFLKPKDLKFITTTLIMNTILNVLMNVILTFFVAIVGVFEYYIALAIAEVIVVVLETLIIYFTNKTPLGKTFLFSLLANAVSLGAGLLNNKFNIIDTNEVVSIGASVVSILILCFSLYSLFFLPQLDQKKGKNKGDANDEGKRGDKDENREEH